MYTTTTTGTTADLTYNQPANLGWTCPGCASGYAPSVQRCTVCGPQQQGYWPSPVIPLTPYQPVPPWDPGPIPGDWGTPYPNTGGSTFRLLGYGVCGACGSYVELDSSGQLSSHTKLVGNGGTLDAMTCAGSGSTPSPGTGG